MMVVIPSQARNGATFLLRFFDTAAVRCGQERKEESIRTLFMCLQFILLFLSEPLSNLFPVSVFNLQVCVSREGKNAERRSAASNSLPGRIKESRNMAPRSPNRGRKDKFLSSSSSSSNSNSKQRKKRTRFYSFDGGGNGGQR